MRWLTDFRREGEKERQADRKRGGKEEEEWKIDADWEREEEKRERGLPTTLERQSSQSQHLMDWMKTQLSSSFCLVFRASLSERKCQNTSPSLPFRCATLPNWPRQSVSQSARTSIFVNSDQNLCFQKGEVRVIIGKNRTGEEIEKFLILLPPSPAIFGAN